MDGNEIEHFLEELGTELKQRKALREPVHVLLIGGAFMVSQLGNRLSTQDIDVILLNLPATTDEPPDVRSRAFRAAVWKVAKSHRLPRHSANDDAAFFIRELTPILPKGVLWRKYDMLEVYIPPREYILVLKLMTFRAKDQEDIMVLLEKEHISTRAEARVLLRKYLDAQNPRLWIDYQVEKTLSILFDQ